MVKGQIEFAISFLGLGGNYVPNGNVQLLCYINSNCVFSKTIPLWGQASQPVSQPIAFSNSHIGSFLNLKIFNIFPENHILSKTIFISPLVCVQVLMNIYKRWGDSLASFYGLPILTWLERPYLEVLRSDYLYYQILLQKIESEIYFLRNRVKTTYQLIHMYIWIKYLLE